MCRTQLPADSSAVNFDAENDAFDDELYFDSGDNDQETEIVYVDVSQNQL